MSETGDGAKKGGYDPSFYARFERIQDTHFWFRARRAAVAALLRRIRETMPERARILELGCGNGDLLRVLAETFGNKAVVGLDMHREGLVHAAARTDCLLVKGNAERPPFAVRFDLVAMFDVLEHIDDDVQLLRHVNRMLTPKGLLIMSMPAHPSLWSYFDEAAHHCRRYTADELTEKLSRCGFQIRYMTAYQGVTYPLLKAGRCLRRFLSRGTSSARDLSESDLKVWPVVNGLLSFLLQREAVRIGRGERLRMGTSFLVLAERQAADSPMVPGVQP